MKIYFLGTASGLPTKRRFAQTIALGTPDQFHLIDVADGASSLLEKNDLSHLAVRSIVISHMHADHHIGLTQLIKTMMHLGRKDTLTVHMPQEGIAPYELFLESCYLAPEWLGFTIDWQAIETDQRTDLGGDLHFTAMGNDHLGPARDRSASLKRKPAWTFESYSFVFRYGDQSIAYTGNLRKSLAEVESDFRGVNVLISELAHLDPQETRIVLERLDPGFALFTHFHPKWDDQLPIALLESQLGDRVVLVEDGEQYDIRSFRGL